MGDVVTVPETYGLGPIEVTASTVRAVDEGTAATVNDAMSLEVVDVRATAAVLRIEPAG